MLARVILPVLVGLGLLLGIVAIFGRTESSVPLLSSEAPFEHYIAATGMVEASSQNIRIGSAITAIMAELFVEPGDFVQSGAPLFRLKDNVEMAKLEKAKATLAITEAKYQRLLDLPRPEDLAIQEAAVEQKKSTYLNELAKFELIENITNPRAVSRDEQNKRRYGAMEARFSLKEAQEQLSKLLAGTWVDDLNIVRAERKEAKESVKIEQATLAKSTIRAPFSGVVLRINRYPGELVSTFSTGDPIMLFGVIDPLNVRVDVAEEEIWRVAEGAPGVGFVRGNRNIHVPLKFLRIDPYVVPKHGLTDVRVLQVNYQFKREELPIYPGQLLDIYIEAKPAMGTP